MPIKAGDKVVLYYASANRDEEVFDDPHTFDVGRTPNDHVTFGGGGVHYCLGASLARAEIKATMRQLVERLPDIELAGPPNRLHSRLRQRHQADAASPGDQRTSNLMRTPICDDLGIEFPIFAFTHCRDVVVAVSQGRRLRRARRRRLHARAARDRAELDRRAHRRPPLRRRHRHPQQVRGHGRRHVGRRAHQDAPGHGARRPTSTSPATCSSTTACRCQDEEDDNSLQAARLDRGHGHAAGRDRAAPPEDDADRQRARHAAART